MATPKSEETGAKILEAALERFRTEGFENATMRGIAAQAGVAVGAAYYYYSSKDAIVLDFYRRSNQQVQPKIEAALERVGGLQPRLIALIQVKLEQFAAHREVLRALLRNGADPRHPISPFSGETREIREMDLAWFRRILENCGISIPPDLAPHLPDVLWLYQMGVIFFWINDDSRRQERTARLLELSAKCVVALIKVSSLPLMRPLRKTALELIEIVKGE